MFLVISRDGCVKAPVWTMTRITETGSLTLSDEW
jgi:hypothetical protein